MNYSLTKNMLYARETDPRFTARSHVTKRISKMQVLEKIAYGCTLTKADILAVLTSLEEVLVEYIALGCSVDMGFISLRYTIKGGFHGPEDIFQKDRNWVKVYATVGKNFSHAVNQSAKPEKVNARGNLPRPTGISKISGNIYNSGFSPGNLVKINGSKLQFDQNDTELGVFLNPSSKESIRVSEYAKVGASVILLKLPVNLKRGENVLEVRTRSGNGSIIRGVFEAPIIIAA